MSGKCKGHGKAGRCDDTVYRSFSRSPVTFLNEKIKPMIDEKYGNGTAEFFAQAFEAFYKDK